MYPLEKKALKLRDLIDEYNVRDGCPPVDWRTKVTVIGPTNTPVGQPFVWTIDSAAFAQMMENAGSTESKHTIRRVLGVSLVLYGVYAYGVGTGRLEERRKQAKKDLQTKVQAR